jgi:hypothetical protein
MIFKQLTKFDPLGVYVQSKWMAMGCFFDLVQNVVPLCLQWPLTTISCCLGSQYEPVLGLSFFDFNEE